MDSLVSDVPVGSVAAAAAAAAFVEIVVIVEIVVVILVGHDRDIVRLATQVWEIGDGPVVFLATERPFPNVTLPSTFIDQLIRRSSHRSGEFRELTAPVKSRLGLRPSGGIMARLPS